MNGIVIEKRVEFLYTGLLINNLKVLLFLTLAYSHKNRKFDLVFDDIVIGKAHIELGEDNSIYATCVITNIDNKELTSLINTDNFFLEYNLLNWEKLLLKRSRDSYLYSNKQLKV